MRALKFAAAAFFGAAAVMSVSADGVATITSFTFDSSRRMGEIVYNLTEEDAIVTLDIQRQKDDEWVSIGEALFSDITGDVNRKVTVGNGRKIFWPMTVIGDSFAAEAGELKAVLTVWPKERTPDYMVCNLTSQTGITTPITKRTDPEYYVSAAALPGGIGARVYKTDKLVMRRIPAADVIWRMGHTSKDDPYENYFFKSVESPAHYVTFTNDYYMAVYECTQEQYRNIRGGAPSRAPANDPVRDGAHPVESFCRYANVPNYNTPLHIILRGTQSQYNVSGVATNQSSVMRNLQLITGLEFDLPTAARWEYACRAGSGEVFYDGSGCPDKIAVAPIKEQDASWSRIWKGMDISYDSHQEVGTLQPNAFGLYDMLGNVAEIVQEHANHRSYPNPEDESTDFLGSFGNPEVDPFYEVPEGAEYSCYPCIAGGCWNQNARYYCRNAASIIGGGSTVGEGGPFDKAMGFRVMCPAAGCGELVLEQNEFWDTHNHVATPINSTAEALSTTAVDVKATESEAGTSLFRFVTSALRAFGIMLR